MHVGKLRHSEDLKILSAIMNGFVLLSASMFIYFTGQILDDGLCDSTNIGVQRDPYKELSYANFIEHFNHTLDVSKIEGVPVQTGSECLLRCVNNDRCYSTNVEAFHPDLPNGKIWCDLLPTDKYNAFEKFKTNHTFHHYSIWVSITSTFDLNWNLVEVLYSILSH